jgi:hypothetical protein
LDTLGEQLRDEDAPEVVVVEVEVASRLRVAADGSDGNSDPTPVI